MTATSFLPTLVSALFLVFPQSAISEEARPAQQKDADSPLKEQSIYLPYEKLWQVFEKEGRGVFLPYEQFMGLWNEAEKARSQPPEATPPVDSLITSVQGTIRVQKDVVVADTRISIDILTKGWHEIPIALGDTAITRAELKGGASRLLGGFDQPYRLLLQHTNESSRVYELALTFSKRFTKEPGRNHVQFQPPIAPISLWDISVPEPDIELDIQPRLAATEMPADTATNSTRVLAFVGAAPSVSIHWTPRVEGAKGLQALTRVHANHEVRISEGVIHTRVDLAYEISRSSVPRLTVKVPAEHKVVNVYDPNVREWSVVNTNDGQEVRIELFEPATESQRVVLELERYAEDDEILVPVVAALQATRQQGTVLIRVSAGLRADVRTREGLLQIDPTELPESLRRQPCQFAYRYAALPFALALSVEAIEPRIRVEALASIRVDPERLTIEHVSVHQIDRAGVFALDFVLPPDLEVRDVRGIRTGDASAAEVEGHHVETGNDGARTLTVNLGRKAQGRVGLRIELRRLLDEPALLEPADEAVRIRVGLPRAASAGLEWENGHVLVSGPESLRIVPETTRGLQPVSAAEAGGSLRSQQPPGRVAMAFLYAADAVTLELAVTRKAPMVTVSQLLIATVEQGVIRYDFSLGLSILYSGVQSVRLAIPVELSDSIRLVTPGVRHTAVEPPPEGTPEGCIVWELKGENEWLGSHKMRLLCEQRMADLGIGTTLERTVPRLAPLGVDRSWGQVVLVKSESIDVTPGAEIEGLRPIDPLHDLMDSTHVENAARAFEFHGDWSLSIRATRYEPQEVKTTSIERGLVRMVATRSKTVSVQALYRMRSARQRLIVELPQNVMFDTEPVRLNGRPVTLERGESGAFFVPLVAQNQDAPFLLELRYMLPLEALSFQPPAFPVEPAVQQVFLSVYLPRELSYLGYRGPWTDEIVWATDGLNVWPRARRDADSLLAWVSEGIEVDRGALRGFAADGRHLLYSSLRPSTGAEGAVRLTVLRTRVLRTILVLAGLVLGLLLLPVSLARRAVVVGATAAALVLLSVFAPSCARAVVNAATVATAVAVLILWSLWFLFVTVPRSAFVNEWRNERKRRRRPSSAAPPAATPGAEAAPADDGDATQGGPHDA